MFMVKDVVVCVNIVVRSPKHIQTWEQIRGYLRFCRESLVHQGDVLDGDQLLVLGIKILGINISNPLY